MQHGKSTGTTTSAAAGSEVTVTIAAYCDPAVSTVAGSQAENIGPPPMVTGRPAVASGG